MHNAALSTTLAHLGHWGSRWATQGLPPPAPPPLPCPALPVHPRPRPRLRPHPRLVAYRAPSVEGDREANVFLPSSLPDYFHIRNGGGGEPQGRATFDMRQLRPLRTGRALGCITAAAGASTLLSGGFATRSSSSATKKG